MCDADRVESLDFIQVQKKRSLIASFTIQTSLWSGLNDALRVAVDVTWFYCFSKMEESIIMD